MKKGLVNIILTGMLILLVQAAAYSGEVQNELDEFDKQILNIAQKCCNDIIFEYTTILLKKELSFSQLFDTFYIPIADTHPQKYHTQYDNLIEERLRLILDSYLEKNDAFLYIFAVDKNGYAPTHNSKYLQPISGNLEYDTAYNRGKRLFNDRTGHMAANNTAPYLLQIYDHASATTVLYDLSLPIIVKGQHWGALRVGYRKVK